ncbi:MAG: MBL fold metallo-hydrolase [Treponema sp.]|nr:MBL fold metallo-hydrolase [Treponema sp.]
MSIHVIRSGIFQVNSLVVEFGQKKCFVVDPAACKLSQDQNKILDYLKKNKLDCQGILLTHCHFDHVTGINEIKSAFPNAKIAIHEAEFQDFQNPPGKMGEACIRFFGLLELIDLVAQQAPAELALKEGDDYFGWKVIHTPGHTPGSICLYNKEENSLISGDTLFAYGGYGRTDMEGGNEKEILASLDRIKKEIPAGTKVYPGHEDFAFSL